MENWIETQLKRFTYKPNWRFVFDHRSNIFIPSSLFSNDFTNVLRIEVDVEDSRNPGQRVTIYSASPILNFNDMPDEYAFSRWLRDSILVVEKHEMDEWIRRDGELLFDPHKIKPT